MANARESVISINTNCSINQEAIPAGPEHHQEPQAQQATDHSQNHLTVPEKSAGIWV